MKWGEALRHNFARYTPEHCIVLKRCQNCGVAYSEENRATECTPGIARPKAAA